MDMSSISFQTICFGGLKSWGVQFGVLSHCSSGRSFRVVSSLPVVVHCIGGGVYGESGSQALLFVLMWPLSFAQCKGIAQLVFRSFSEEIITYVAVDSVCLAEEASSGSFLHYCLELPLKTLPSSLRASLKVVGKSELVQILKSIFNTACQ